MACKSDKCQCKHETMPKKDMHIEPGVWYNDERVDSVVLRIKKLENFVALPEYKTEGAAAMDLYAAEDKFIEVNKIEIVKTGIAIAVPQGYEAQIRARSGLAAKGLIVANGPGTIDSDYRGEVGVILANLTAVGDASVCSKGPWKNLPGFSVKKGDRIAQMVIAPVTRANLQVVEELDDTVRGSGAFGSTGI